MHLLIFFIAFQNCFASSFSFFFFQHFPLKVKIPASTQHAAPSTYVPVSQVPTIDTDDEAVRSEFVEAFAADGRVSNMTRLMVRRLISLPRSSPFSFSFSLPLPPSRCRCLSIDVPLYLQAYHSCTAQMPPLSRAA